MQALQCFSHIEKHIVKNARFFNNQKVAKNDHEWPERPIKKRLWINSVEPAYHEFQWVLSSPGINRRKILLSKNIGRILVSKLLTKQARLGLVCSCSCNFVPYFLQGRQP